MLRRFHVFLYKLQMHPAPPFHTSLAAERRIDWLQLGAAFALLAFLIMVWRWGGTVADSQAYYDTARYLRGEIPASELVAPFPYRLLVPAVASVIPSVRPVANAAPS